MLPPESNGEYCTKMRLENQELIYRTSIIIVSISKLVLSIIEELVLSFTHMVR